MKLFKIIVLSAIISSSSLCSAETVKTYISTNYPDMNEIASGILAPLGSLSTWEKLFIDRLATLSDATQKNMATKLAMDGRITQTDLAALPVKLVIPQDPAQIIGLLSEHSRSDYWTGFYRRHKFSVDMKMKHWDKTAQRRYDDPELCKKLIEIFFQLGNGTYNGPMELEYHPASEDLYRPAD